MAVKGLISDAFIKDFENLLGYSLANGLVINGVLGWLHAAHDKLEQESLIKTMKESFMQDDIDEAKKLLVEIVTRNADNKKIKDDKELTKWTSGRKDPGKREKQIDDIINKFSRLDAYNLVPEFLMSSKFVKRAPVLVDSADDMSSVSYKVKMLQSVIVNLGNKVTEETRSLRNDMKSIKTDINNIKPSFATATKKAMQPVIIQNDNEVLLEDHSRERKRSKRDREGSENQNEVFDNSDSNFQHQSRRGFLSTNNRKNKGAELGQAQPGLGPSSVAGHDQAGQQATRKASNSHWKQNLPMVTGQSKDFGFAAPADLFVFNVNKDVTADGIMTFMKSSKGLEILECQKVSHIDARTQSFRVKVKSEDYEKALNGDTWPYYVRVRVYKHFRQRDEGGQFSAPKQDQCGVGLDNQPQNSHGESQ